ncbi:hypothetical protein F5B19DRAFT_177005 [Rostrohypoxylon terebratum]|nr:hypothetical protein F5B19DRAFT_177005 [Rostrohypoxylon terebratum]
MDEANHHQDIASNSAHAPGQYEPPPSFFRHIDPIIAHAFFSTENGRKAFRNIDNPVPSRPIEEWSAEQVQVYADTLRARFYDRCRYVQPLGSYEALYIYFDAHDIYYLGARNLCNVIHYLWEENQRLYLVNADMTIPQIDTSIQEALFKEENQKKLRDWSPESATDIMTVFTHGELGATHDLSEAHNDTIRSILMNHWIILRRGGPVKPMYLVNCK